MQTQLRLNANTYAFKPSFALCSNAFAIACDSVDLACKRDRNMFEVFIVSVWYCILIKSMFTLFDQIMIII